MVSGERNLNFNEVKNWSVLASRLLKLQIGEKNVKYICNTFDKKTDNALKRVSDCENDDRDIQTIYEALKKFISGRYEDILSYYNLPMEKFSHLNSRLTDKHGLTSKVSNINDYTLNRVFLEEVFPDLIAKSSVPEMLIKSHQLYLPQKGLGIRIPHKCWSPDGGKILFVGAMEKDWCANVYTVNIETKKTEKVLEVNDTSRDFNPDLEWTENGMVITCPEAIFVKDVKVWEHINGVKKAEPDTAPVKLDIPSDITEMRNGRISPDGEKLMFFGIRNGKVHLFIYNLLTGKLQASELGDDLNMENYQGAWINRGKRSIIKGEYEYQRFRGIEDLRK